MIAIGDRIIGSRIGQRAIRAWRHWEMRDILGFQPLRLPHQSENSVSIHVLTSTRDWMMAIWMLRSFFIHYPVRLPVFLHDDGTLTQLDRRKICEALPGVVIIDRHEMRVQAERKLAGWPKCLELRHKNWMTLKLFDPWLCCNSDAVLLFDSDLLFFGYPADVHDWVCGPKLVNRWNRDVATYYTLSTTEIMEATGIAMTDQINCGLGLVTRESIDFGFVEELLRISAINSVPWLVEQTIYAILSSRFGVSLLPKEYLIDTDPRGALNESLICKHYVGCVRALFYRQGIDCVRSLLRG